MTYRIGKRAAGTPEIEIDGELFTLCKESKRILASCLSLEEKYEILITNYFELESRIVHIATSNMVRVQVEPSNYFDLRLELNVKLMNILSAARLYVDSLASSVTECMPHSTNQKAEIKQLLSEQVQETDISRVPQ